MEVEFRIKLKNNDKHLKELCDLLDKWYKEDEIRIPG